MFVACCLPLCANAVEMPPIEVIVVGVPSTGVKAYQESPLGDEIVKMCGELIKLFSVPQVHSTTMCTTQETTYEHVNSALLKHFQGPHARRITLLFFMAHGEPTQNGDVRLLMSDTTDDNKDDHSFLVRQQLASTLANASDSVAIGFVDACFSGKAAGYRLTNLGIAAEDEGVHVGLLASAQAYQQAFNLSFTKALIETWKTDCPKNPDDFISAILGRMGAKGSSPVWLMTYHGSACFGELLQSDKRVMSIWRDPRKKVRVSLFDDKSPDSIPIRTIPPGVGYGMPYVQALVAGVYRVETHDEEHQETILDKSYCDLSAELYCEYVYPPQADPLVSLNVGVASYKAAIALGYSDDQLTELIGKTVAYYNRVNKVEDKNEAAKLIGSSPQLLMAIMEKAVVQPSPILYAQAQRLERQDLADINNRIAEIGQRTATSSEAVKDVDAHVQAGIASVMAKADEADSHALDAANKASAAEQAAAQASSRVESVETVVGNIDKYHRVSQIEIRFGRGETTLTNTARETLKGFTASLKDQHGYIIQVQGFSSAGVRRSQEIADVVTRYLVADCDIPLYRIYVLGMGAENNLHEIPSPQSDRVEVVVLKSQ